MAKAGKAVKPKRIVATADHLLNALFKRTYDALSSAAQRVFLLLCSWRVYVPEVAVQAISLRPGTERFDVAGALEEAIQFSLVDQIASGDDDERFVGVPLAAAIFRPARTAGQSLQKLPVEEDRKLLMGVRSREARECRQRSRTKNTQLNWGHRLTDRHQSR